MAAPPEVEALAARVRSGPSAAVHFRRSDYASNPSFAREIGVLDPSYYQCAIQRLRKHSAKAKLYLFSDEIEAIAREFTPDGPPEFVRCVKPSHAYGVERAVHNIRKLRECS